MNIKQAPGPSDCISRACAILAAIQVLAMIVVGGVALYTKYLTQRPERSETTRASTASVPYEETIATPRRAVPPTGTHRTPMEYSLYAQQAKDRALRAADVAVRAAHEAAYAAVRSEWLAEQVATNPEPAIALWAMDTCFELANEATRAGLVVEWAAREVLKENTAAEQYSWIDRF